MRLDILRAAARVFRVHGYGGAGIRDIAAAADLSAANLYHYFKGKDEILFFCQDHALDRLLAGLAAAQKAREPLVRRMHTLAATHVMCLINEVDGSTAHFEVDALPPVLREKMVDKRDRYELGVRALVAAGIRRGVFQPADPVFATRAFLGALNWTAQWFRPEGPRSPAEVAEMVANYAVAGLGGAGAVARPAGPRARQPAGPTGAAPPGRPPSPRR